MENNEIEFEDGEIESEEEDDETAKVYVPLPRPLPHPSLQSRSSHFPSPSGGGGVSSSEEDEADDHQDENDSSDSETPSKRPYSQINSFPSKKNAGSGKESNDGGALFNQLARKFQQDRKKKNNVWGSILQEESLTSDLSSIGVSKKKKTSSYSDRGAETYDYSLAEETKLNRDLDDYFKHKPVPGCKRSIHDRLGPKNNFQEPALDNMSIPPPGVPRIIPDLSSSLLEKGSLSEIAEELAAKLCEPKTELITGVLEIIGVSLTLKLFEETRSIEKKGGQMIKNGSRRRTPGGLFLQLLRESKEEGINQKAIKQLFNVSSKAPQVQKQKKNFQAELKEFRKLSEDFRNAKKSPDEAIDDYCDRTPEPFVEPEAPPNSVERPLLAHDDDDDELHCDTLDIELS